MRPPPKKPGMDYRLCKSGRLERTSGKTWEPVKQFNSYKGSTAEQPMQLLLAPTGDIYFDRIEFQKRTHRKMQLLAEGTKAELWPLFLTYSKMMEGAAHG